MAAVSTNVIRALMKAAQSKTCSFTTNVPPSNPPPPTRPIKGSRNESVNAPTTAVNAAPMTTATARSTTLPRSRKSLKPLSTAAIHAHQEWPGRRRAGTRRRSWRRQADRQRGGGGGRGQPGRGRGVDREHQQAGAVGTPAVGRGSRRTGCGQDRYVGGDHLGALGVGCGGQHVDPV